MKTKNQVKVYIVNAFTKNNSGGNKAGVVINCDSLSSEDMLNISSQLNLSEIAFIRKSLSTDYDYEVRFFTPTTEVDLCGHATIAAFYTLGALGLLDSTHNPLIVKQKTLAGILDIQVNFNDNKVSSVLMTQGSPEFYSYIENTHYLCSLLGITENDAGVIHKNTKPMIVSTGLKDIIFPVKSLDILKKINPDYEKLKTYTDSLDITGLHAFTFDTENPISSVSTRNFAPSVGINEESATGTSNGALCSYIMKHKLLNFSDSLSLVCEQGYYMNNPSEILCYGYINNDVISIKVGGTASIEKIIDLDSI